MDSVAGTGGNPSASRAQSSPKSSQQPQPQGRANKRAAVTPAGANGGEDLGAKKKDIEHTADSEMPRDAERVKEDGGDNESRSDSDGDGNSADEGHVGKKGKRYHRHTARQIMEMEQLFKDCPHPDEKQRLDLSNSLNLEPRQVKFWFQNRRTQMKAHSERAENSTLRAEVDLVRTENANLKELLKRSHCPKCGNQGTAGGGGGGGGGGADVAHIADENTRLKMELERLNAMLCRQVAGRGASEGHLVPIPKLEAERMGAHPTMAGGWPRGVLPDGRGGLVVGPSNSGLGRRGEEGRGGSHAAAAAAAGLNGGLSESEREVMLGLGKAAIEEILKLSQVDAPLWVKARGVGGEATRDVLDPVEYAKHFPTSSHTKGVLGLSTESSRATAVVMMHATALVEILVDPARWIEMFPEIVSRAIIVDQVSAGQGPGKRKGLLQLMYAETQVLSPLVPTREAFFLRYCSQLADSCWAVADVMVDSVRNDPPPVMLRCRRKPSGILIQDMPNGSARVTCIEHLDVDNRGVHRMFSLFVASTAAFGAHRWVSVLKRQCHRLASLLGNIPPTDVGVVGVEGRRSMMRLARRMTCKFCMGVSSSTQHVWTQLAGTGVGDVRVMTRRSVDDPGEPQGMILSAATSMWVPVSPQKVFEYLKDEKNRSEWDVLANGACVTEMSHMAKGQDPTNNIALLKVQATDEDQANMVILQETCRDASGALIVYAPVDIPAMQQVISGGDSDYVALLPSGFCILPDMATPAEGPVVSESGTLLTVAFQILVTAGINAKLSIDSVTTVNSLISCTVHRIRTALRCPSV